MWGGGKGMGIDNGGGEIMQNDETKEDYEGQTLATFVITAVSVILFLQLILVALVIRVLVELP